MSRRDARKREHQRKLVHQAFAVFIANPIGVGFVPDVRHLFRQVERRAVTSVVRRPIYRIGDCWFNVKEHIDTHGGDVCTGWTVLRHDSGPALEAHANWRDPSGTIIDITDDEDPSRTGLFIEDLSVPILLCGIIIPAASMGLVHQYQRGLSTKTYGVWDARAVWRNISIPSGFKTSNRERRAALDFIRPEMFPQSLIERPAIV